VTALQKDFAAIESSLQEFEDPKDKFVEVMKAFMVKVRDIIMIAYLVQNYMGYVLDQRGYGTDQ
jgi:hypothetical protein